MDHPVQFEGPHSINRHSRGGGGRRRVGHRLHTRSPRLQP